MPLWNISTLPPAPWRIFRSRPILPQSTNDWGDINAAERVERETSKSQEQEWPDPFLMEYYKRRRGYTNRLYLAEELERQDRWLDAVEVRQELLRLKKDDQVMVSLGFDLLHLQQPQRAEQILRAALALNPNRAGARDCLGTSLSMQAEELLKKGERAGAMQLFENALVEFRESSRLNPKEGRSHFHAGMALRHLGRLSEAVEEYKTTIQTSPDNSLAHHAFGELLLEMNKAAEAIPALEEAIRLAPADPRPRALLEKARSKLPTGQKK